MPTYRGLMKAKSRAALVAVAMLAGACADRGRAVDLHELPPKTVAVSRITSAVRSSHGGGAPVVIVAIDGVRWQEIFQGTDEALSGADVVPASAIVPNLHAIANRRGAFVGVPGYGSISASGPNYVSLPGYTELLGGRTSKCTDNGCPRTSLPSLLDEASSAGAKVAAFSSWDKLDFAATSEPGRFFTSCGRKGSGALDPWPGHGSYRPDRVTAALALEYLEDEQPDVLFLGLGDTDEYAHRGDYAGYVASLRHADEVVGRIYRVLDRMGARGNTTHVIVTTDHGRAEDFRSHGPMSEAARVWMLASGPRIKARGAVASPYARRLADIAPTLRVVLGLSPDLSESAGSTLDELF